MRRRPRDGPKRLFHGRIRRRLSTRLLASALRASPLPALAVTSGATAALGAQEPAPKLDRPLAARMQRVPDRPVAVLLALRPPPAPSLLRVPGPDEPLPRAERHARALQALRGNAATAQAEILRVLESAERSGDARGVERFWIANYVRAEVSPALLRELAARPDVERIYLDRVLEIDAPPAAAPAGTPLLAGESSAALEAVGAPAAWDQGFTGRGVLVANLDSGVQGDHPALAGKWRGLHVPVEQAWFDPFLNTTFPVDDDPTGRGANGHGTATMGLLVGGERSVGVAFEAEWIAANIFENNQSFVSTILRGLEWAADPDGDPATVYDVPDVINASFGLEEVDSLGIRTDRGLCDPVFDPAVAAAEAAGSVLVFSAGNFSQADPGDITAPASSLGAFAVGAVDVEGGIASFSGRGPSLCEGPDRTKPDVVAPGVAVRTLNRQGGEQFLSGTSFASPIAGGIAALIRQKNPRLSAVDVKRILRDTARDIGDPGPDNTFGRGLVDAPAALNATPASGPVLRLTGFVGGDGGASGAKLVPLGASPAGFFLLPGENSFAVSVTNPTQAGAPAGTARLASRSPFVEVLDAEADLPELAPGGRAGLPFRVRLAEATPPGSDLGLTLDLDDDEGGDASRIPFTLVAGEPVAGQLATHDVNEIRTTVTNFGAIGFWLGVADESGRRNELLGEGFHFPAEDETNFLFHASFMVGRSPEQVSDDLPYGNVAQSVNDFHVLPGAPFRVLRPGPTAAQEVVGEYDDSYNLEGRIGMAVRQHSYAFDEDGRRDFVILTYDVANRSGSSLSGLRFGLFADWDFVNDEGVPRETMDFVPELKLAVVEGPPGTPVLGIVGLTAVPLSRVSYRSIELSEFEAPEGGTEITEAEKFEFLSAGVVNAAVEEPQDLAQVLGFGPEDLAPGGSTQAAFAFVAGRSLSELRDAAARARFTYETEILGREPPPGGIPSRLTLDRPFPNPLLPGAAAVTVGVGVPAGELGPFEPREVELRVLDVRGRIVRTLVSGDLAPGFHQRTWSGLDDAGRQVPSGVYVLLAELGSQREVRKLVVVR